jgi:K+-transporting ATPase ATPase C chain
MKEALRTSVVMLATWTLLTGVVYPLVVTAAARIAFPTKANGSLIFRDGKPVGSSLVGQAFSGPRYFWGRPSATSPIPYNAASSGGSNLGPLNPALKEAVQARIAELRRNDPRPGAVPVDLVTASGSGLDPHISPASAEAQASRVAKARGMSEDEVRALIVRHTEGRQFGVLGEPRVNVLPLNLSLDEATERP